jgi:large subunit ribosomal protein L15
LKEGDYEINFSLNGNSEYGEIGYPTRYIKVRKGTPNITLTLNTFKDGSTITLTTLVEKGLIKKEFSGLKVLGAGELDKKLVVKTNKISASAKAKIESLGGTVEVL